MPPERVNDVLALVGDAVDNVPGVPGIGDKGARDLVREFGSVEAVLENADKVEARRLPRGPEESRGGGAALETPGHAAHRRARQRWTSGALACREADLAAAHALFKELEFQVLAREFAPADDRPPRASTPAARYRRDRCGRRRGRAERAGWPSVSWSRAPRRCRVGRSGSRSRGLPAAPSTCPWRTPGSTSRARPAPSDAIARLRPVARRPVAREAVGARQTRPPRPGASRHRARRARLRCPPRLVPARSGPARLRARGPRLRVPGRAACRGLGRRRRSRRRRERRWPRPGRRRGGRAAPSRADAGAARAGGARLDLRTDGAAARRRAGRHGAGGRARRHAVAGDDEPRDGGAAPVADRPRSTAWPRASSTSTRRSSCARSCSSGWG